MNRQNIPHASTSNKGPFLSSDERQDRSAPGRPRFTINISNAERVGRVVLGAGAAVVGAILLLSAHTVLAVLLELLLVAAGLDLVVTGALGHCPLYQRLGHVPASLRRAR